MDLRSFQYIGVFLIGLGLLGWVGNGDTRNFPSVSKVLEAQDEYFLVTRRIVTQVVAYKTNESLWLGTDEQIVIGTVTVKVGFDLSNVQVVAGNLVRLPESEINSIELDEDTVRLMRDATAFQRLATTSNEVQSEARKRLKDEAVRFILENGVMPTVQEGEAEFMRFMAQRGLLVEFDRGEPQS